MSDPFLVIMWDLNKYSAGYCYLFWKEKHKESETACACTDAGYGPEGL